MREYIACWCNEGLEHVIDVTTLEQDGLMAALTTGSSKVIDGINRTINMMIMRARFNTQRSYEIYKFSSTDDISAADIRAFFNETPQAAAEWVRKNGAKIFGERSSTKQVIF